MAVLWHGTEEMRPPRTRSPTSTTSLRAADGIIASRRAFEAVAASLGRGVGGLVNLHDPEVVTLGGVAALLRANSAKAFDDAYKLGLMAPQGCPTAGARCRAR